MLGSTGAPGAPGTAAAAPAKTGKAGKAEKIAFAGETKDIKKDSDNIKKIINETILKKKKNPTMAPYYNIELVTLMLNLMEKYYKINDLSVEMLDFKNNRVLDEARKEFYKILQLLEETVGNEIDRPLKENKFYLSRISRFSPRDILQFLQRIHKLLAALIDKFGDTKWQWSFVELQARVAVITKNMTSFHEIQKYKDPRNEFFYDRRELMLLCKESLTEAARQYRQKYEMAGKDRRSREDLKKSIEYLSSLRRIHAVLGEEHDAAKLQNIIDAGRVALESEDKSKDQKDKEKTQKV